MENGTPEGKASPQASTKKPTLKWYWNVLGLSMMAYVVLIMLSPVIDSITLETVRCEVISAQKDKSSGGSRGSATTAGVLIETSNCGPIYWSKGVTFDNREEIAASFEAGREYEFDMGWYSRVWCRITDVIPSADGYRLVT